MTAASAAVPFGLLRLFLVFAKIGSVLFGSGYVLLAFLRADLVQRLGWLTEAQLLDAIAIGQITPGPVFYDRDVHRLRARRIGGSRGCYRWHLLACLRLRRGERALVPRLRRSRLAGAALDGVNVASLALMAMVAWELGRAAIVDAATVSIAIASLIALIRFRVNSAWLIGLGGALGWFFH